jgi:hypothetical protein
MHFLTCQQPSLFLSLTPTPPIPALRKQTLLTLKPLSQVRIIVFPGSQGLIAFLALLLALAPLPQLDTSVS